MIPGFWRQFCARINDGSLCARSFGREPMLHHPRRRTREGERLFLDGLQFGDPGEVGLQSLGGGEPSSAMVWAKARAAGRSPVRARTEVSI